MASIRERGPHQFQADIRLKGYPTQRKTFETKKAAREWAIHIENEMLRGTFVDRRESERTTLAEALERYYQEICSQKAHPQQERRRINQWLKRPLASKTLASIRGIDLARFRDQRRREDRAENTIRLELAIISHLYEIARKEWGMDGLINPVKNIKKPSGSNERDRRLQPGEYELLAAALDESGNSWVRTAFDLAIETCLRQGMLCELRWEWVDLQRRVINIPTKFRTKENKGVPAKLPLSSKSIRILAELPRSISGKILPMSQNALVCAWKRARDKAGIADLHWHDLRHEGITRLFELGLNPMEVASITGHKSLNMLRRYTHLQAENLAQKLG